MGNDLSSVRPYKGPVPYGEDDAENFFGRSADIERLRGVLRTERIVVLHSPSGAGKTSLIQAGLLPRMQQDGFKTLPAIRVNHPLPLHLFPSSATNRFSYSVIRSLEPEPVATEETEDGLAGIPLSAYFAHRSALRTGDERLLLVFDQFEEIFTIFPHERSEKLQFFRELGRVLQEKKIWALFAIREEYVGALDIYSRMIPTNFTCRYHLDLLTRSTAEEAIRKPIERLQMSFEKSAVTKILNDLTGEETSKSGSDRLADKEPEKERSEEEYTDVPVDPLYLQLVCEQVWSVVSSQKLDRVTVDAVSGIQKIEGMSAVDCALMQFYESCVEQAAKIFNISERNIRDWIQGELIQDGRRRPTLAQKDPDSPLAGAQRFLDDQHILRASLRVGSKWYELAHDRLVYPVLKSNDQWYETHLSLFEQCARQWHRYGKPQTFAALPWREWSHYGFGLFGQSGNQPSSPLEGEYLLFCRKGFYRRWGLRVMWSLAALFVAYVAITQAWIFRTKKQLEVSQIVLNQSQQEILKSQKKLNRLYDKLTMKKKELDSANQDSEIRRLQSLGMQQRYMNQNHDVALLLGTLAQNSAELLSETETGLERQPSSMDSQDVIWSTLNASPFSQTLPEGSLGGYPQSLSVKDHGARILFKDSATAQWKVASLDLSRHDVKFSAACGNSPQSYFRGGMYVAVVERDALHVMLASDCMKKEDLTPPQGEKFDAKSPIYNQDGSYCAVFLEGDAVAIYRLVYADEDLPHHVLVGIIRKLPPAYKGGAQYGITAVAFSKQFVAAGDEGGATQVFEIDTGVLEPRQIYRASDDDVPLKDWFRLNSSYAAIVALSLAGEDPEWLTTVHIGGLMIGGGRIIRRRLDNRDVPRLVLPKRNSIAGRNGPGFCRQRGYYPSGESFLSAYFGENGQTLITGGDQGSVTLWDLSSPELKDDLRLDPCEPQDSKGGGDSRAAGKPSMTFTGYGVPQRQFQGMAGGVREVLFTRAAGLQAGESTGGRGDSIVLAFDTNHELRIWDPTHRSQAYSARHWAGTDYCYALAFKFDGQLITTSNQGRIATWKLGRVPLSATQINGDIDWILKNASGLRIRAMDLNGNFVVVGLHNGVASIFDIANPSVRCDLKTAATSTGLWSVAFRPQNPNFEKRFDVATGDGDGNLRLWDLASVNGRPVPTDKASGWCQLGNKVTALSYDPRGRFLLAGTDSSSSSTAGKSEGKLYLIDLEGRECQNSQASKCHGTPCISWIASPGEGQTSLPPVHSVAFSDDGQRFAEGGDYGSVRWWTLNSATGVPVESTGTDLRGARGKVNAVKFLPGGKMLAAVGQDGLLRVWSLAKREKANPLTLRQAGVELLSLAVSRGYPPIVAAGDARGGFHLWDFDTSRYVCNVVLRNLTWKEWLSSVGDPTVYRRVCSNRPLPQDLPKGVKIVDSADSAQENGRLQGP